ncbi:MAG: NAD(P)/FAD-dependent oxidoreductase [Bilophila wadsworthia]
MSRPNSAPLPCRNWKFATARRSSRSKTVPKSPPERSSWPAGPASASRAAPAKAHTRAWAFPRAVSTRRSSRAGVAVIGGGNTCGRARTTGFASKVYRAPPRQFHKMVVDHALSNPKIVPDMDSVLESIEGSDIVEKIVVRNVKTNEKREIPLSGVFIFIGTLPNDEYVHDLLQKDEGGWIVTDASLQTSVPGIFAAGDVRDTSLRQVVTAAGDGARAAMSAYAYLQR